eukprot:jgi/Phyca11/16132/fgenesh1_pg.PHYCAscaffold_18_\
MGEVYEGDVGATAEYCNSNIVFCNTKLHLESQLQSHQRIHKREKGTTAPSAPLEHYYMLTKFGRHTRHGPVALRCTSGQLEYCQKEARRLASFGGEVLTQRRTGNGIDLRRYVSRRIEYRTNRELAPQHRRLKRSRDDVDPTATQYGGAGSRERASPSTRSSVSSTTLSKRSTASHNEFKSISSLVKKLKTESSQRLQILQWKT